ncbi:MAG: hypothetical protein Q4F69_10970 [Bacteroidia bacterium]|nr:hypothetical protein [Bacteroidia bacterium]
MRIRAFITHKKAEQFKDCQDRFSINVDTKSVAVSDGMSQSYQQKLWADLLVNTYTGNAQWEPNLESVKKLAPLWNEKVRSFIQNLKDINAPQYLIIRNENALALRKSAGATFCGIRFHGNKWNGYVLGDSCLIEIDKHKIQNLYTSQNCDEFDNHPDYFDSNPLNDGKGTPLAINGILGESTSIIMVSDPFSDFLLEKRKTGDEERYIKQILAINNHDEFEKLVDEWRDNHNMHNDDSTLIIIEYDGNSYFDIVNHDQIEAYIAEELKFAQEQNNNSNSTKNPEEEKKTVKEPSNPNVTNMPKTINDDVERVTFNFSDVPIEEFIQTGVYQYEKNKAMNESTVITPPKDDIGVVRITLEDIYNIYYQYFNK